MKNRPKPVVLIILDGWGINPETEGNAVIQAQTPNLDALAAAYPKTRLTCSGEAVGLPEGIMGNSEVGHLNIGAGRVVYQDLLRIDRAIEDRSFFSNEALTDLMKRVKAAGKTLHLMGLVSDGGVHSQLTHLLALLDMASRQGIERTCVHAILDGRDTPPKSGAGYVRQVQDHTEKIQYGALASICGRYWAMDRDTRWERTEKAYRLYTKGEGVAETDPVAAVEKAYGREETDEFVKPIVLQGADGKSIGTVQDGDGIIFFNFRADRARQITRAFTQDDFQFFDRSPRPQLTGFTCMTLYDETFDLPMAFPPAHLKGILGEVVSKAGLSQLRIAETEKYAHVTYFFNGGEETPFPGEDRCLIKSPRDVATYDLKPEMSAIAVKEEVLSRIQSGAYDLIVLNFANMDMVGHSGIMDAAVRAVQTVDACVGDIVAAVKAKGGAVLITADHGNSEKMVGSDGSPHTAHTTNPVPLILVHEGNRNATLESGVLGDLAPTLLAIMGLSQPPEMTGRSLLAT